MSGRKRSQLLISQMESDATPGLVLCVNPDGVCAPLCAERHTFADTHTGVVNAIKAPLHDLISMRFSTRTGAEGELTCIYLLSCCQTKHCCN